MKGTKIFVGGIQGSGKTYCASNYLIKVFDNPYIWGVHPTDWKDCKNAKIILPKKYLLEELDRTCAIIKKLACEGKCDAFFIDEADWFLPNNLETLKQATNLYDLIINHRHYKKGYPHVDDPKLEGLALVIITRRPQSIPTEVVETCEYLFTFAIEGENVVRKFRHIHPDYEILIPQLSKDKHNFVYKRVGTPPKLYSSIQLREVANQ